MRPSWLPDEICLDGQNIEEDYSALFAVFERDFIVSGVHPIVIEGSIVRVNTIPDPNFDNNYPFGFTHIITKGVNGDRVIDYDRARKLSWVRPVLENYNDTQYIKAFWSKRNKKNRPTLYLWLYDFDFMVLLTKMKSKVSSDRIIVTAFHVHPYNRQYYQKLLETADTVL